MLPFHFNAFFDAFLCIAFCRKEKPYINIDRREADRPETELAFRLSDRYVSIQQALEVSGGYNYTIYDLDYQELDGGVYGNKSNGDGFGITIRQALNEIVEDPEGTVYQSGLEGSIQAVDRLIPIDYGLMEKAVLRSALKMKSQKWHKAKL